ncbi:MAG: hypothetical protein ACT443_00500 [Gemmatimonadota bacterium]
MKLKPFAFLACVLVVGLSACREDPTEENVGVPEAIVSNRSETHQAVGATFTITAYVVDGNLQRIPGALTASAAGSAVTVDSAVFDPILAETDFFLRANAATEGTTVTLSGQGLTKDVKVVVE